MIMIHCVIIINFHIMHTNIIPDSRIPLHLLSFIFQLKPFVNDQLIILLLNFEDVVAISSTLTFLQNDFQRIKYPFVLISQAYIGLILIHTNATKAYFSKEWFFEASYDHL
ncbi:Uncharacterized protein FWK35_00015379 [Aphis craccivora]|uniref:Uncharacterized protein n=1 Tax=Aphis craccivora TaxID=307492 RepID=A0A6G0Y6V1_APHCR|nr:Uncharacterized protein FWK35_00015379 [Aphis craccivora]